MHDLKAEYIKRSRVKQRLQVGRRWEKASQRMRVDRICFLVIFDGRDTIIGNLIGALQ